MGRLTQITFGFPEQDEASAALLAALASLLTPVPGVARDGSTLRLLPQWPVGALPATTLTLAPATIPEIVFAVDRPIGMAFGSLRLRGAAGSVQSKAPGSGASAEHIHTLPPGIIAERLKGRIVAIDHTGVNLPAAQISDEQWDSLLCLLGEGAGLYRYPGGEPWPFIIPTTGAELDEDIRAFAPGRTPKFELVHDRWAPCPVLQFALVTDFTREELETRLPDPHGVAFPDLGHLFRTVYVQHPWPGLLIRLDLTYSGPITDWDTGEWLVTAGGRLR